MVSPVAPQKKISAFQLFKKYVKLNFMKTKFGFNSGLVTEKNKDRVKESFCFLS